MERDRIVIVVRRTLLGALLIFVLIVGAGCGKKRIPPPPPLPPAQPQELVEGDARFDSGDWSGAAQFYDSLIAGRPDLQARILDGVRFRLGMIHANPDSSLWDPNRARELLEPLAQVPGGAYQSEAAILLTLLQQLNKVEGQYSSTRKELQRVAQELETLKEIDRARRRHDGP